MCPGQKTFVRCAVVLAPLVAAVCLQACAAASVAPAAEPPADPPVHAQTVEEKIVLSNTLRWKTASEVDNFGFDVFRGPAEEGPFDKLNAEIIPGAGTTDEPQQYAYVDDTIEEGVEYWYYVESISIAGVREQFTPIFKAKAKYPPGDE